MSTATQYPSSPGPGIDAKVAFLRRPDAYPERPARVEAVETHMSWIFLTDRRAYKLKKPVRYDFLDFSTAEARRWDCEEEVRLNRRLAPDVYLGVLPLTCDPQGRMALDGEGEAIDWLVKMRRLPEERMLDHAIRRHVLREADIERVALRLARFYRASRPIPLGGAEYVGRIADNVRENLRELATPAFGLPAVLVRRIGAAQLGFLRDEAELFEQRARAGRIVEGHGDLRPEHVCMEAEPAIIDCLEFRRDFRILDAADELAFLAMECERLGEPSVGPVLFETYSRETGDAPPAQLLSFYKSYRACLRAKISIWHLKDAEVRRPEKWPRLAREYLELAQGYLSGP